MSQPDYDDPAVEEQWCSERRKQVTEYLTREKVQYSDVGEWPAWHVAPYVSIWAIESLVNPGSVGWWVICGDLPTDSVSAEEIKHPREAMLAFSRLWRELSEYMERGEPHPDLSIGSPEAWPELWPLLRVRARMLRDWAEDDREWDDCG